MLDSTRPCNSKNRKANRYTKEELISMASKLPSPPKHIRKMTIDSLCALFSNAHSKKSSPISGCRVDHSRPCQAKSRKPNRYTKKELSELWKTQCSALSNAKPKTINEYCNQIRKIEGKGDKRTQPDSKLEPMNNVENKARLKIASFLEKLKLKKNQNKKTILTPHLRLNYNILNVSLPEIYKIPKRVSPKLLNLIKQIETNNISSGSIVLELDSGCGSEIPPLQNMDQLTALFNRNLTLSVFQKKYDAFVESQTAYIKSLSWIQQLIILGYTYGGDQMLNNLILEDSCDPWHVIPDDFDVSVDEPYCRYLSRYVYPLAIFLHLDVQASPDVSSFLKIYDWFVDYFNELLTELYKKIKGKKFHQNYATIFHFFVEHRNNFPSIILENYILRFKDELENIIKKAPKTNFQFWVYRGITKRDYVVIGSQKKHVFQNHAFMSTSINLCRTLYFKEGSCCIQQILVPKGVCCLLISLFSSFPNEGEILFAPKSWMYPLSQDYVSSNGRIDTRKFLIAN